MVLHDIYTEFTRAFYRDNGYDFRGIGIKCEIPVVTPQGKAVSISVIQDMFKFLEREGFQLKRDDFSNYIISASRINDESLRNFDYYIDTIMTDAGSSILESSSVGAATDTPKPY